MPDALVILPTYNELANLERVVAGVRAAGFPVLVVDDASPDGTGALADSMAARDAGVTVLHRPCKLGLGSAYVAGFRHGLELGYGFLLEMDADGSHPAEQIAALVEAARASGGLALGSRYVAGGVIVGWSRRRQALSRGANAYCRALLGREVRDWTSGFRCYPRAVLEAVDFASVISDGYGFQIEMVARCLQAGFGVIEVPIRFEERQAGRSKVSEAEIRNAVSLVPRLRMARRGRGVRPVLRRPDGFKSTPD
ncbi:MAG: polyprenol monophosphomannose synthase [Candidatus Dormibacteraeota bacterium]|nr:polyprenol monophosphomannose synthase [Candidatus Dormibacteraeota bacterium]